MRERKRKRGKSPPCVATSLLACCPGRAPAGLPAALSLELRAAMLVAFTVVVVRRPSSSSGSKKSRGKGGSGAARSTTKACIKAALQDTQGSVRPSVSHWKKNTYLVHNVSLFGFGARARVSMSVRGGLAHSAIGRGSFSCPPAPPLVV